MKTLSLVSNDDSSSLFLQSGIHEFKLRYAQHVTLITVRLFHLSLYRNVYIFTVHWDLGSVNLMTVLVQFVVRKTSM